MRQFIALGALLLAASASAAIPSSEREALVSLYQATNGDAWTHRDNWLGAPGTECTWYGVSCSENDTVVSGLELYQNNLTGTIPSSIGSFSKLQYLHLWQNSLHGPIPPQIGQLSELVHFFAANNTLSGELPPQLGDLQKLESLSLAGNELTGALPPSLGGASAMKEMYLDYNRFTGAIPVELSALSNLTLLELSVNQLTGTIPPAIGSLAKLEHFGVVDNDLEGGIPSELGQATALISLRLAYNHLTGEIPAALGQLHALEQLHLNNNELTGTVPSSFDGLGALIELDLTTNHLSGPLPPVLFMLPSLLQLKVGDNDFTGTIPAAIASLTRLEVLSLYSNELEGPIPLALTTLPAMRSIELQNNNLSGAIPAAIAQLTNLTWIDLAQNELTGELPRELGSMANLEFLSLYENDLSGPLPGELGQLAKLRTLYVGGNRLSGNVPEGLRNLHGLERFSVNGNLLSGSIPSWIGELTALSEMILGNNRFTGTIPASVSLLENLAYFDVGENFLVGPLPDFTRMTSLVYLRAQGNQLSGPLPASIGALVNMDFLQLNDNQLSGPLPREIGQMRKVSFLALGNNNFEGPIPAEIGQLTTAYNISLYSNRFTGTIPREIGNLTGLQYLDLSFNALRGPIPPEIMAMTGLLDEQSDFFYNALFSSDPAVKAFMDRKQYSDESYESLQTVTPANARVVSTTDRSATLDWTPIAYRYHDGGYQVVASKSPGGPPAAVATTAGKDIASITVRNLEPSTQYFFTVSAVTHPHWGQKNLIVSDPTAPLQAATSQRVLAPAEVVLTDTANGMVQIDGVEVGEDSFTLTNYGDVATTMTLERGGDFFTFAPQSFTLAAGATQVVRLTSLPQPAGTYYGHVAFRGEGEPEEPIAYVVLLSTTRPAGTVVAEPIAGQIEFAGDAGTDSVGVAQFRNSGTARLTGVVISDQPWVEVTPEPITIEPGSVGSVNFKIVRAKRPAGAEGALTASLSLVYVNGAPDSSRYGALATSSPVSVSKVTIVDVTKPQVATGSLPPLSPGEIPFFIPGVTSGGTLRSDLSIVNATGSRSIDDLKLYFTRQSQTTVASLQPLGFTQSVNLVNVVGNIYAADGGGTLQVRSTASGSIGVGAKATVVTGAGTYSGAIPVFRGDRSIAQGTAYLAGVVAGGDLFVQETAGATGTVRIEFLDAAGNPVGTTRNDPIAAYGLLELAGVVPANAATAAIAPSGGSAISAYARQRVASGDTWSVVDWSLFYRYERTTPVRVPFAEGSETTSSNPRRRSVRHGTSSNGIAASNAEANASPRRTTDLVLFNPGATEVRATLVATETSGRTSESVVTVGPRATVRIADAAVRAGTAVANIVVNPGRGELVVTARTHDASGGSAIPVLDANAGLRIGQAQVFPALEDSAQVRTGYGFVETSGAPASVRARVVFDTSSNLVTASTERTFAIPARGQLYLAELLRSFAGADRDTLFGDEHGLVLELEVVSGAGSIVPFVVTTDLGTGDPSVLVQ